LLEIEVEDEGAGWGKDTKEDRAAKGATKEKARKRKQRVAQTKSEPKKDMSAEEMNELKRQQRLMRNRQSAQLSRERKKRYLKQLEDQIKDLTDTNVSLTQQVMKLNLENSSLKERCTNLEARIRGTTVSSPLNHSPDSMTYASSPSSPEAVYPLSPLETTAESNKSRSPHKFRKIDPSQRGSPTKMRTGIMLFALVLSFGIFYSLSGLNLNSPTTTVYRSRVLMEETRASGSISSHIIEKKTAELPSTIPIAIAQNEEKKVMSLPSPDMVMTEQQAEMKDNTAVVSMHSLAERKSLVPAMLTNEHAVAPYEEPASSEPTNTTDYDVFLAFKKILLSSNLTLDTASTYLFCPSALQIQPHLFPGRPALAASKGITENDDSELEITKTRRNKRLRKLTEYGDGYSKRTRSDDFTSNGTSNGTTEPSPSRPRLNLWLPTSSLLSDWIQQFQRDNVNPKRLSGLSEVTCEISDVRPVLV